MTQIYTMYLLHFDRQIGRVNHYLGICKQHRLHKRMQEHARGVGGVITHRAHHQQVGFTIAATWLTPHANREKQLKAQGHFRSKCPVCKGQPGQYALPLDHIHYDPAPPRRADATLTFPTI